MIARLICALRGHIMVRQWPTRTLPDGTHYHEPSSVCARCKAKGLYA